MRAIASALEVSRSNLIEPKKKRPQSYRRQGDGDLLEEIKAIISGKSTYGYRRVTTLLNRTLRRKKEQEVNHKRVYRIMKENHLLLKKPKRRPKRAHTGKIATLHSNTRWCSDSFSIQCINGDQVHVAFALDTCDREVLSYIASSKGINGEAIRDLMLESLEHRLGKTKTERPIQWLSDNGSCYTAKETVEFGRRLGLDIRTTPPHSPESNGMSEAFVKTFKRDYAYVGDISSKEAVMKQLPGWFEDYNEKAPHKALKMLSPREFLRNKKLAS